MKTKSRKLTHLAATLTVANLALATLAGCAAGGPAKTTASVGAPSGDVPGHFLTGKHPKFPKSAYITGSGSSSGGADAALSAAQSQVSRQISSALESEFKSLLSEVSVQTEKSSSSRVVQEVSEKTKTLTAFEHAELIESRDTYFDRKTGNHYTFVALERGKASQVYGPELKSEKETFEHTFTKAKEAAGQLDLPAFLAYAPRARESALKANSKLLQLSVITGNLARFKKENLLGKLIELGTLQDTMRDKVEWFVHVSGDPKAVSMKEGLIEGIFTVFHDMGFKASEGKRLFPVKKKMPGDAEVKALGGRIDPTGKYLLLAELTAKHSKERRFTFCRTYLTVKSYNLGNAQLLFTLSLGGEASRAAGRNEDQALKLSLQKLLKEAPEAIRKELTSLSAEG